MIKTQTQMIKVVKMRQILKELGLKNNNMACYIILTALNILPKSNWNSITNNEFARRDVIPFANKYYHTDYEYTTGEETMKLISYFKSMGVLESTTTITNSPDHTYKLTSSFFQLMKMYKKKGWSITKKSFIKKNGLTVHTNKKNKKDYRIKVGSKNIELTNSKHGQLTKQTFEEYLPKYIPNGKCLYIDDTSKQNKYINSRMLNKLKINITEHGIRPDMIVYDEKKNTVYFIEIVTSSGAITEERVREIKSITTECKCKIKYRSVFGDIKTFNKFRNQMAKNTGYWFEGNEYIKK